MKRDWQELIHHLNTRNAHRRERKPHRLPLQSYAATDCDYFFTICARHRGRPFVNPGLARGIINSLLWRRQQHRWTLSCYCLMPDHLHFILRLPDEAAHPSAMEGTGERMQTVLDQVGQFKRYATTKIWWKGAGTGRLWQRSSYDRVIHRWEAFEDAAFYVLQNPVRKGLVADWQDYPHAGIVDDWRE